MKRGKGRGAELSWTWVLTTGQPPLYTTFVLEIILNFIISKTAIVRMLPYVTGRNIIKFVFHQYLPQRFLVVRMGSCLTSWLVLMASRIHVRASKNYGLTLL